MQKVHSEIRRVDAEILAAVRQQVGFISSVILLAGSNANFRSYSIFIVIFISSKLGNMIIYLCIQLCCTVDVDSLLFSVLKLQYQFCYCVEHFEHCML